MINPPPYRPLIASRTSLHHHNVAQCWHIHVLVHAHETTYGRSRCVSLERLDARGQCTLGQRVVRNDTQNNKGSVSSIFGRAVSCQDACTHEKVWPPTVVPSTYCSLHTMDYRRNGRANTADAQWAGFTGYLHVCSAAAPSPLSFSVSPTGPDVIKPHPFLQETLILSVSFKDLSFSGKILGGKEV